MPATNATVVIRMAPGAGDGAGASRRARQTGQEPRSRARAAAYQNAKATSVELTDVETELTRARL
jgi:hypothetical protein